MKNKFKLFMRFVSLLSCEKPYANVQCDEGNIEYVTFYCNSGDKSIPQNMTDLLTDVLESSAMELYDEARYHFDDGMSSWSNFDVYFDKTTMRIGGTDVTVYGTEDTGSYYEFGDYEEGDSIYDTFIEVQKFLNEINSNGVRIDYNGSGDSGYIEGQYQSENGSGDVPAGMEDICYNLLEDFGGWEINEGSQGNITLTKNSIDINHQWNTEESDFFEHEITLTVDSFDE
jgi:hypothetical protein